MKGSKSRPEHPTFLLGIEGGGTRTTALLADSDGREIKRVITGPANLRRLSDDQLLTHFREIQRQFPPPHALGVGLAGGWEDTDWKRILRASNGVWPGIPCWATNDLEVALIASHLDDNSPDFPADVLVLSGTGSCCYGRNSSGGKAKIGGWGNVLGDPGSGYDVGLTALRRVVSEYDRSGKCPSLGIRLMRVLQLNSLNELIDWASSASVQETAALAPEVVRAPGSLARALIKEAASKLARDAAACSSKVNRSSRPVRFVFAGGLLLGQPRYAREVKRELRKLRPSGTFVELKRIGAWGGVELARRLLERPAAPGRLPCCSHTGSALPDSSSDAVFSSGLSPTELRNPASMNLDRLPLREAIRLMLREDEGIPAKLLQELPQIERVVRLVERSFRKGGRLFYVGAGTSGRLGVLDASECPPTFGTDPEMVQGIIAGGQSALWKSIEGGEDDAVAGAQAILYRGVTRRDVVVGIAASGTTKFVWGSLSEARSRGAATVLLCFNPNLVIPRELRPQIVLAPNTGPEVLTGSTRLKAGTATKLLLNMITTLAMVRLGKVASNLMVDLNPSNAKLKERAVRIVVEISSVTSELALETLERFGWNLRTCLNKLKKRPSRPPATS